ncbi:MAG: hypothetical protein EOO73_18580 [Myxococcales bacterium]|nr:MAG: hypothetical protein EOO73_18580 [Myxococcales bacterium]
MLVLVGPSFAGGDADYQRLSQVTGMVAYDLRSRLKPGMWGLLKALADEVEAQRLAASLKAAGLPVVVIAREVATDPARPIVALKGLRVEGQALTLELRERAMEVPVAALCCIVRGEAQVGKGGARSAGSATSSATFRAVVPDASDLQVFRESSPPIGFEAFATADLHFHSVPWIARIDARSFDFRSLGIAAASPASALDTLVDRLALLGRIRVDRAARASSIASFTQQAGRHMTPHPHPVPSAQGAPMSQRAREISGDERFDPYSRVIGEAERVLAAQLAATAVKA